MIMSLLINPVIVILGKYRGLAKAIATLSKALSKKDYGAVIVIIIFLLGYCIYGLVTSIKEIRQKKLQENMLTVFVSHLW